MKHGANHKKIIRVSMLVLADMIAINLAAFFALFIRFEFSLSQLIQSGYLDQLFRFAVIGKGTIEPLYLAISWAFTIVVVIFGIMVFNKVERTFMDTV